MYWPHTSNHNAHAWVVTHYSDCYLRDTQHHQHIDLKTHTFHSQLAMTFLWGAISCQKCLDTFTPHVTDAIPPSSGHGAFKHALRIGIAEQICQILC
jgi:hypothetical protein